MERMPDARNDNFSFITVVYIVIVSSITSIPLADISSSLPMKLTDIEFSLMKAHAQYGYEILKDVESPWPLAEIVLQHHERLDGSGYPQGLKDGGILMEARILTVADVVESMSSHRPYRPSLGLNVALKEIEDNAGILYDREVVEVCLRLFREKGFKFE
jgi:HD-GYP domain-containing protein (c-di-GMP phosphodiesterase class II)